MSDLVSQKVNMIFKSLKGETVHALKDITFSLKKGELLTVLGPSGCGKTTLLNIAAGFLRPTSGKITLGENEINYTLEWAKRVGFLRINIEDELKINNNKLLSKLDDAKKNYSNYIKSFIAPDGNNIGCEKIIKTLKERFF